METNNNTDDVHQSRLAAFFIANPVGENTSWNDDTDSLNDIIDSVKERYSFMQYGAKSGQTYFEHATNGIHSIVQLFQRASDPRPDVPSMLDDAGTMTLVKSLCLSYLVHDLNKMEWNEGSKNLWHRDTVMMELEAINDLTPAHHVDTFFTGWREHVNDMAALIKGHSRINANRGDELFQEVISLDKACKLGEDDITLGVNVMRLVDLVDLIRHPSQKEFVVEGFDANGKEIRRTIYHENLFKWINVLLSNIAGKRMKTSTVRVTKEASRFTNVLLNQSITALETIGIFPLRVFTTGLIVAGTKETFNRFYTDGEMESIQQEIGNLLARRVGEFLSRSENIPDMFNIVAKGITFTDFVYQQPDNGVKIRAVMEHLSETIHPVKHDIKDESKSSRFNAASKLDEHVLDEWKDHPLFTTWEGGRNAELMENDTIWKLGRYVHTAFFAIPYAYKTWKNENIDQVELMKETLETIGILDQLEPVIDKFTKPSTVYRYYFSHVIGKALFDAGKTMDDIKEPLIRLVIDKIEKCGIDEMFISDPVAFVKDHLQLFSTASSSLDLVQASDPDLDIPCTACGKRMATLGSKKKDEKEYKWKSQFVPAGIPVEKSSNFLVAGMQSKSVRTVCSSCKWRHYLDKILATVDGKSISTWYCTFYPRDGLPYDAIMSIQQQVKAIKDTGDDEHTSFRLVAKNGGVIAETRKGYGFQFPSIPDEICGSFTIDWKVKKSTVNDEFWEVLEQVLLVTTKTGMRCIVTKLRNDYEDLISRGKDIVFQDVPPGFKWLLGGKDWLTIDDAIIVLDMMGKIGSVINQTVTKDHSKHKAEVAKRLEDPLSAIHYIEHHWNDDRKRGFIRGTTIPVTIKRAGYFQTVKELHELHQQVSRS